jgi:hypothetical protein
VSKDLVLDIIAKKNSRDLSTLADEFDRLAKQTDDAGNRMHRAGTFAQFLDAELAKTKVHVKELGEEFDRTGNKDVFAKLRGAQGNLRSLERIKTDLSNALENGVRDAIPVVESSLSEAGNAANKGFWQTFSSLPPEAQAGIVAGVVGIVAITGPAIGSAIGGAILAGVGAVGLGAAIAAQIHDPSVADALGGLKDDFGDTFRDATSDFAPVLVRAAGLFDEVVKDVGPGLKGAFSEAAPYAEAFLTGVAEFVKEAAPGLETALVAGSKILAQIGESDLPELGRAVSEFFDDISTGSREGGDALHYLFFFLEGTLRAMGTGIAIAEALFGKIEDVAGIVGGLATGDFSLLTDRIMHWNDANNNVASSMKSVGGATHAAAVAARDLSAAFDTLFGKQMSVDEADIKFKTDLLGLKDALDKHSHSLSDNSLAGLHNKEVVLGLIQDAENARQAQIDMAGGANASKDAIDKANASYEDAKQKIIEMGIKAGLSRQDLERLAGRYDIDIVTHHTDVYSSDYQQHSRGEHASGGSIFGLFGGLANTFSVGEQGREYLTLPAMSAPAYVTPNSVINGAANRGGGDDLGTITVVVKSDSGDEIIRKIVTVGRRTNRKTFDTLIPVGTAK